MFLYSLHVIHYFKRVSAWGMIGFIIFALMGIVNWPFFLDLLIFIWTFGFLYSVFAILMEVVTFNQYKKNGNLAKLMLTALPEPLLFHPFVMWSAIRGNIDLIRNKKSGGVMNRKGFDLKTERK